MSIINSPLNLIKINKKVLSVKSTIIITFLYFNDLIISYLIGGICSGVFSTIILVRKSNFGFKGEISLQKYLNFAVPWTVHAIFYSSVKYLDVYAISLAINSSESIKIVGLYSSAKTLSNNRRLQSWSKD